jgi:hypothetical protein
MNQINNINQIKNINQIGNIKIILFDLVYHIEYFILLPILQNKDIFILFSLFLNDFIS